MCLVQGRERERPWLSDNAANDSLIAYMIVHWRLFYFATFAEQTLFLLRGFWIPYSDVYKLCGIMLLCNKLLLNGYQIG